MLPLNEFMTDRGQVIGFGRVKIPRMPRFDFDYEIPLLSFVVTAKEGGGFVATCIHLQIDGYGNMTDKAISDMVQNIWYFLRENFKGGDDMDGAWANLLDVFKNNPRSAVLWDAYHALQIGLAQKGVSSDRYSELHERIQSLETKVRKLEEDICKKDSYISDLTDSYISEIMNAMVIEYERG